MALQNRKVSESNKYWSIQEFGPSKLFQVVLTSSACAFRVGLKYWFVFQVQQFFPVYKEKGMRILFSYYLLYP